MNYISNFLFVIFILISFNSYGQNRISEKEFEIKYANSFKLVDNNIEIQRVIQFPTLKKEDLIKRVKFYFDDRIQKKYTSTASNSDYSYSDDSFIITEELEKIQWNKFPVTYAKISYIYKLEIKDYKIRATIIMYSFKQPEYYGIELKDCFPFTNKLKRKMLNIISDFIDYSENLFDQAQKSIENIDFNNDW